MSISIRALCVSSITPGGIEWSRSLEDIEIFLNGKKLFDVENNTFTEAGKIGLWTKADAITQFDDLRATSLDQPSQPPERRR